MRNLWLPALVVCSALAAPVMAQGQFPPAASRTVDYDADVRPILAQNCYSCHGPEAQQSGLRLDLRQNALRGGDYGPVITAGNSADSKLIKRLVNGDGGLQMPPTGPLSDDEIGILRAWIDQGTDFRTEIRPEAPPAPVDPKVAAVIAAVRSRDRATLETLIAADPALVTSKDAAGSTPLHHAAGFGTLDSLTLLIDKGADVNAKNRRGSTPLFWALHDEAKVRLLVSRGAAVKIKQVEGRTPVYQASLLGNGLSVLRLLLDNGGDPNVATLNGLTPLSARCASRRRRCDASADRQGRELLTQRTERARLRSWQRPPTAAPAPCSSCSRRAPTPTCEASLVRRRWATPPARETPKR